MPAKDFLHDIVVTALTHAGWTITHDPYTITFGVRRVYIDLGARQLLAAEREAQKIAVEVKSFVGLSQINDLEKAIGQYAIYKSWLTRTEPERQLYIALDIQIYEDLFGDISGQVLLDDYAIKLIVVEPTQQKVVKWIS